MFELGRKDSYGPVFFFETYEEAVDKLHDISTYDSDGVYNDEYFIYEWKDSKQPMFVVS